MSCIATAAVLADLGVQYVHFPLATAEHGLNPQELAAVEDIFALDRFGSLDSATLQVANASHFQGLAAVTIDRGLMTLRPKPAVSAFRVRSENCVR